MSFPGFAYSFVLMTGVKPIGGGLDPALVALPRGNILTQHIWGSQDEGPCEESLFMLSPQYKLTLLSILGWTSKQRASTAGTALTEGLHLGSNGTE